MHRMHLSPSRGGSYDAALQPQSHFGPGPLTRAKLPGWSLLGQSVRLQNQRSAVSAGYGKGAAEEGESMLCREGAGP